MIICLHKGKGVVSRMIKWGTRGEYSHASILMDGVGTIFEAREGKGVRVWNVDYGDDDIDYFYLATPHLD